jgi:hypothetical protein
VICNGRFGNNCVNCSSARAHEWKSPIIQRSRIQRHPHQRAWSHSTREPNVYVGWMKKQCSVKNALIYAGRISKFFHMNVDDGDINVFWFAFYIICS